MHDFISESVNCIVVLLKMYHSSSYHSLKFDGKWLRSFIRIPLNIRVWENNNLLGWSCSPNEEKPLRDWKKCLDSEEVREEFGIVVIGKLGFDLFFFTSLNWANIENDFYSSRSLMLCVLVFFIDKNLEQLWASEIHFRLISYCNQISSHLMKNWRCDCRQEREERANSYRDQVDQRVEHRLARKDFDLRRSEQSRKHHLVGK